MTANLYRRLKKDVPEVPNVQMNEIKKKSNYACVEFFQKVKTLNFVERKCDFFSEGVNYQLNFEEIPHKKFNFFLFRSFERSEFQAHLKKSLIAVNRITHH